MTMIKIMTGVYNVCQKVMDTVAYSGGG